MKHPHRTTDHREPSCSRARTTRATRRALSSRRASDAVRHNRIAAEGFYLGYYAGWDTMRLIKENRTAFSHPPALLECIEAVAEACLRYGGTEHQRRLAYLQAEKVGAACALGRRMDVVSPDPPPLDTARKTLAWRQIMACLARHVDAGRRFFLADLTRMSGLTEAHTREVMDGLCERGMVKRDCGGWMATPEGRKYGQSVLRLLGEIEAMERDAEEGDTHCLCEECGRHFGEPHQCYCSLAGEDPRGEDPDA